MQSPFSSRNQLLHIEKIVNGGYGLAFSDKKAYFVPYVLPGETVAVREVERKRGVYFVKDYEIVNPSEERILPECDYFGRCGGCQFQMADYETQLEWKKSILQDVSERFLKENIFERDMEFSMLASSEWHYRYRARFQVSGGTAGFFKQESNEIVAVSRCLLVKEKINQVLKVVSGNLKRSKSSDFLSGLKAFEVKTNLQLNSVAVLFISSSGNGVREFSSRIVPELEELFESVSVSISLSKNRLPGKGCKIVYGPEKIYSVFGRYSFGFSPLTFFQPNLEMAFEVYETVMKCLKKAGAEKVVDVYCGAGVLDVLISEDFEVLGIEANSHASKDAIENAFINESTAQFMNIEAEALAELKEVDSIIVNPPRSGMSRNLVDVLLKEENLRTVIYLSCNPATFFRDTEHLLKGGFSIESLQLVDFYPQTSHIEVLAAFKRQQRLLS